MTSSSTSLSNLTVHVDHGVLNIVGGHQITNILPDPSHANRQGAAPRFINDAPLDLLSVHFTGRGKDLEFLEQAFEGRVQSDIPSRCAVYGMPGLGKTQLVLRYAKISIDQHRYSYIFWISATSLDKLNQGIAGILHLVGHQDRYHQEQNAKLTAARLWLEECCADWLLVLDNVNRTTLDFIRMHLPHSNKKGNILFTTRTADVAEVLVNAAGERHPTLQLTPLGLQDTAKLFFKDAGIEVAIVTPSLLTQAEELVKCLGCLPLAVVQAASFMKQTYKNLDDILRLYENKQRTEAIRWENDLSTYEERSVAAAFTHQFDQLLQESRDISNFLKMVSFFDPESIPLEMIVAGGEEWLRGQDKPQPVPSRSVNTMLRNVKTWARPRRWKSGRTKTQGEGASEGSQISLEFSSLINLILSPIQFQMGIQKLQSLSLVEQRSSLGKPSLWMHDLIQFMVQEGAKKEEAYQDWLRVSVLLVCGAFRRIGDPILPQQWVEYEKFIPHIRSLEQRGNEAHDTNLALTQANTKIAVYLANRGRYDEAEELLKKTLTVMNKRLGAGHQDTLWSSDSLAVVYQRQGRYNEAEELHKQSLAAKEEELGVNHQETLQSMDNLAVVYQWQGRYKEAEELHQRSLAGREKQLGAHHPETLTSMNSLANVYRLQGRFSEAGELHKQTLASTTKQLGLDHPGTLLSMNLLANVYRLQGQLSKAEELYEQALAGRERQLGAGHPDTLESVNSLANTYRFQGRLNEAEELYKRALAGREKQLTADHPDTLTSANSLALVYRLQGRLAEAEELHKRALAGREKQLGIDHPETLTSMYSLALVYESQELFGKAEKLYKQVLAGREKQLGLEHPETRTLVNSLTHMYESQGRFNEMEELQRRASVGQEKPLGFDHPVRQ